MNQVSPSEFIRYVFSSGYIMSSSDLVHAYDAVFKEIYLIWKETGKFDRLSVNSTLEIKGNLFKVIHPPDKHLNMIVEDSKGHFITLKVEEYCS